MADPMAPKTEQEKDGINDPPVYNDAPPAFDDTTVLETEDGNVINYKTLSWWYVREPPFAHRNARFLTRR